MILMVMVAYIIMSRSPTNSLSNGTNANSIPILMVMVAYIIRSISHKSILMILILMMV